MAADVDPGQEPADLEEQVATIGPARPEPLLRETFLVHEVDVTGNEERRDAAGQVVRSATVDLTFVTKANIPGLHPHPAGNGNIVQGVTQVAVSERVGKGLDPDTAIEMANYMIEEAKRVKATMKEQPLTSERLAIANGQGDVEQAARAKAEVDKLAGGGA